MTATENNSPKLVFMLDVDNTLIDNDQVKIDVGEAMEKLVGPAISERFWEIYEQVRKDKDTVDIPETLRRIQPEVEPTLYQQLYRLWMDFPYTRYLFPNVFEVLYHLNQMGATLILSDGDPSFQLRKIVISGLSAAVYGNVLIYIHKQHHISDILYGFPADHYVMVEDKPDLLTYMKRELGERVTTVLVKQGKYARDPKALANAHPDIVVDNIGLLRDMSAEQFLFKPVA